jgi:hypothetical protein
MAEMKQHFFDILEDCLQALERGEPLEAILARYPDLSADLRPVLESAQAARAMHSREIPAAVRARGRARVLAAAARLRQAPTPHHRIGRIWRVLIAVLASLTFLAASSGGLIVASAAALPGDALYPIKRVLENTRLQFTNDPVQKQVLTQQFSQLRVDETQTLLTTKRVSDVEFDGQVAARLSDGWLVAGIPVVVTDQTLVAGTITVGQNVNVIGQTQVDQRVRAVNLTPGGDDSSSGTPDIRPSQTQQPDGEYHGTETPESSGTQYSDHSYDHTPEPTDNHTPQPSEDH